MADDQISGRLGGTPERPARFLAGPEEFAAWLALHHDTETELWMGLNRKHVPDRGLTWEQAVVEALCWGWIDSVAQRIDGDTRRQRWTPRKPTSHWSRINLDLVEKLRAEGRMQPSGEAIWAQRRSDAPPYSHKLDEVHLPASYAAQLAGSPAATVFWEAATATYRKVCMFWVTSAKQEATRDRRTAHRVLCRRRTRPQPALRRPAELARPGRRCVRHPPAVLIARGQGLSVERARLVARP